MLLLSRATRCSLLSPNISVVNQCFDCRTVTVVSAGYRAESLHVARSCVSLFNGKHRTNCASQADGAARVFVLCADSDVRLLPMNSEHYDHYYQGDKHVLETVYQSDYSRFKLTQTEPLNFPCGRFG